jgi:hypothetical protein
LAIKSLQINVSFNGNLLDNEEEIALEKENEDDCKKTSNYQNLMKYSKRMRGIKNM